MIPRNHIDAAEALRAMLSQHHTVSILVSPELCAGLADFPRKPVRIDLSHHFPIPMHIRVHGPGLYFDASFNRVSREVWVPWSALLWAGVPRQHGDVEQVMTPEAKPAANEVPASALDRLYALARRVGLPIDPPDAEAPAADNVIHVDFAQRRRLS
jgi:hypothetical protein